jgi:hypothetical protein
MAFRDELSRGNAGRKRISRKPMSIRNFNRKAVQKNLENRRSGLEL